MTIPPTIALVSLIALPTIYLYNLLIDFLLYRAEWVRDKQLLQYGIDEIGKALIHTNHRHKHKFFSRLYCKDTSNINGVLIFVTIVFWIITGICAIVDASNELGAKSYQSSVEKELKASQAQVKLLEAKVLVAESKQCATVPPAPVHTK